MVHGSGRVSAFSRFVHEKDNLSHGMHLMVEVFILVYDSGE
jgi:hypothetical protein